MKSWKTSIAGWGTIATAIGGALNQLTDGNPATNPDFTILVPLIISGLVGIFARDNGVPSAAVPSAAAAAERIKSDTQTFSKP